MQPILAMLNMWEVIALIAVVLIIFGAKKLPELARGFGLGLKEFKKASHDDDDGAPPTKPA
jgi:sec-independent protein translocase protein TatA